MCVSVFSLLSERSVGSSLKRYTNILPDGGTSQLQVASVHPLRDKTDGVDLLLCFQTAVAPAEVRGRSVINHHAHQDSS